jgi:DnaJ like chaperone protein
MASASVEDNVGRRITNWWGKLLMGAFGYMLGGPLGALLGAVFGHGLDRRGPRRLAAEDAPTPGDQQRVQMAFFTATFSVMGHLAKVDGRVSEAEVAMARSVMDRMALDEAMRRTAVRLFTEGKAPDFPLDQVVEQFRIECHRRQTLLQLFVEIQLQAAYADGALTPDEERMLLRISQRLHLAEATFRRLQRMVSAEQRGGGTRAQSPDRPLSLNDAFAILGLSPAADADTVRRAYRRLLSQHHPDKLVAKGLPEEMMQIAAEKTREIRQAYEQIRQAQGF